ncbi:MAG: CobD/CbiB family cobalamin biosynthesis protein [Desulfovibrionaceae bacterium]
MILPGMDYWWLIPVAFFLDMAFGDPPLPWRHPVCIIGNILHGLEPWARRAGASRPVGLACMIFTVTLCAYGVYILTALPVAGLVFSIYFAYAGLATRALLQSCEEILTVIEEGSLEEAQQALSRVVTRDTTVQDRDTLRKSLADSLSENVTDAVVAPIFWLLVGGPVGLWGYKVVSTMDSMWGYKIDKWRRLGWAGARMDDVLAFIPARLAVLFLWGAGTLAQVPQRNGGRWPGFAVVARQAGGMESPNSGWPMAAASWLLGARMGGPTVYFGALNNKPWVGLPAEEAQPWDAPRLRALLILVRNTGLLAAVCLYAVGMVLCVL